MLHSQFPGRLLCGIVVAGAIFAGCRRNTSSIKPAPGSLPPTSQSAPAFVRNPQQIVLQGTAVRIPMELISGMPVLHYQAADGSQRRLLVDTGSDSVAFAPAFAAADHRPTRASDRWHTDFSSKGGGSLAARVDVLNLGPVQFKEFDADVFELFSGMDALLGWPMFQKLLVTLDYPNRTLVLTQGQLPPPDGKDVLPLRFENDRLEVQIKLDERELWVALDSGWGNGGNIELTSALADSLEWVSPPRPSMSTNTALGTTVQKLGRLRGKIAIGRHTLVQPVGGTNQGDKYPILGAISLWNFALTLDLKNMRARFVRASDEPIQTPSINIAGFNCDLAHLPLKVLEVVPDSEAERAGLHVGDILDSIDGKPARDGLLEHTGSEPFQVKLHRDQEPIELSVPMTCLVK